MHYAFLGMKLITLTQIPRGVICREVLCRHAGPLAWQPLLARFFAVCLRPLSLVGTPHKQQVRSRRKHRGCALQSNTMGQGPRRFRESELATRDMRGACSGEITPKKARSLSFKRPRACRAARCHSQPLLRRAHEQRVMSMSAHRHTQSMS